MSTPAGRRAPGVETRPAAPADAVVAAMRSLPTVRLSEESAVATYLPGRRVTGVRIAKDRAEVHVALVYPTTVQEGAAAVRAALVGVLNSPVDVVVDDVLTAEDLAARASNLEGSDIAQPEVGHE